MPCWSGYGVLGDQAVYAASLGINVNLWSGLGILVFGGLMLAGGWRAMKATRHQQEASSQ